MRMAKILLACVCVLAGLLLCLRGCGISYRVYINRTDTTRDQLLVVWEDLAPGNTKGEVESVFENAKCEDLQMDKPDESLWVVSTPTNLAASNWVLWLGFDGEKLRSMRIRVLDDGNTLPRNVPEDRLADGAPAEPRFEPKYTHDCVWGYVSRGE